MKKDPTKVELLAELEKAHAEIVRLREERNDLELILEMTTEHSDSVENELFEKALEALERSEKQLRLLVNVMPTPVLIASVDQAVILYANQALGPLLGMAVDEVVGYKVPNLYLNGDDYQTTLALLHRDGQVNRFETRIQRTNGKILWVEVSLRRIMFNDRPALLTVLHDVTGRRLTVESQAKAINQLRWVDKVKDEFLANTSHELRTPLNGIIGLADSMLHGVTGTITETQRHNLSMIATSGRRLANLVNDILDFSELRHKGIVLQTKPVRLRQLVDIVFTLLQPLIGELPVHLENEVNESLPAVAADEDRLQQILFNLVGNGIKFTQRGEVRVSAEMHQEAIQITVSDTGIGIPEDKFDTIFRSFEQGDSSTARVHSGTGLGLSITKQLIELHGGQLEVESIVGQGSSFIFALPISDEVSAEIIQNSPAITRPRHYAVQTMTDTLSIASAHNKPPLATILIVDDEPVNRQVLINHLEPQNYHIIQASNGIEALEKIAQHPPDLILLDVMMPHLSGYEMCLQLRKKFPAHEMPVIMLTAKNHVTNLVQGFQVGANDYLAKPVSRDELLARMKTHLYLKQMNVASGRFVPSEFLGFLQKQSVVDLQLGDHISREMTVMFSDMRDFTTLSEDMTPQQSFDFINAYFECVTPVISNLRGFIVKFLGDGMMAIFPESADDAVLAGLEKVRCIRQFNEARVIAGQMPIQVGIGIHTGQMMVGMIGSHGRMQGDAMSDHVNLSARVEGLTKFYGASLLISEETRQALRDPDQYQMRFVDRVRVKGRADAVVLYELFGADPSAERAVKQATKTILEKAQQLFYDRQFTAAQVALFSILQQNPKDRVAWHYLTQTAHWLEDGTPDGWTGVTIMTKK